MKLSEIIKKLDLEKLNNKPINNDVEISYGYIGDLLSQVLASIKPNESLWITIQSHLNIVGVAVMAGIPVIIICENHEVSNEVISKADEEKIAILRSKENAFQLAGRLVECGIK